MAFDSAVLVGQSTGGNIVVDLAARVPDRIAGVAGVDGGALELSRQFSDWERCEQALRPPALTGTPAERLEGWMRRGHPTWSEWAIEASMANFEHLPDGTVRPWLSLDNHLRILRSLWEHLPSTIIPKLDVPVLLVMADTNDDWADQKRVIGEELMAASGLVRVEWFSPGDHDLHAQHPVALADLLHAAF